jgi:outer membrane biosynthesis protein TonB
MRVLQALLPVLIALQAGVPPALAWTWPVDGPVLQEFTLGEDPYARGQHRGVDLEARLGDPVRAPARGTVSFAGTVPGGGRTVTIRTDDGYSVTLLHLGTIEIARGEAVDAGSAVGTAGASGDPEHVGPYVHLGIRLTADPNGYVNPLGLLPTREAPPPTPLPPEEPEPVTPPVEPPVPAPAPPATAPTPPPDVTVPSPAPAPAHRASAEAAPESDAPATTRPVVEARTTTVRLPAPSIAAEPRPQQPRARETPSGVAAPAAAYARRTLLRSFELPSAAADGTPAARPAVLGKPAVDADAGKGRGAPLRALLAVAAAAFASFGLLALAVQRRQVGDARAADAATLVLLDAAGAAAEDAGGARSAQHDRLVSDRDLEGVTDREAEPLPDLDRNDDTAQLVQVPNDPCRPLAGAVVCRGLHRARSRPSSRRLRTGALPAR